MKFQVKYITIFLCLFLIYGTMTPAYGFSDINDKEQSNAAEILWYMDIVNGDGSGGYRPNDPMSRAAFCKIVLTMVNEGKTAASYQNQRVFPDVPSSHWGAGYINGISKKNWITGYIDGTFGPENTITKGQAVTVILKVLGYEEADIGMFWPDNYMAKAEKEGILQNIPGGANEALTRGEAALLIYQTLLAKNKSGNVYATEVYKNMKDGVMIFGSSSTDSQLTENEIKVGSSSGGESAIYTVQKQMGNEMMGRKGMLLLQEGKEERKAIGFLPYKQTKKEHTIKLTTGLEMTDTKGIKIAVKEDTPVIRGSKIKRYADCFYDLLPGQQVTLSYDSDGHLESILQLEGFGEEKVFILSQDGKDFNPLKSFSAYDGGSIYKNGTKATIYDLKKYDAVTYNEQNNVYYVSDHKVSGTVQDASPAISSPNQITVLGQNYKVLDQAKKELSSIKIGDKVTIILSINGDVAGVIQSGTYDGGQYGFLEGVSGKTADITLLSSGKSIKLEMINEDAAKYAGSFVTISNNAEGKAMLFKTDYDGSEKEDFYIRERKLGGSSVANHIGVYERIDRDELRKIDLDNIKHMEVIPKKDINGILYDKENTPIAIVLNQDVSGDTYTYGQIGSQFDKNVDENGEESRIEKGLSVTNVNGTKSGAKLRRFTNPGKMGGIVFNAKEQAIYGATLTRIGRISAGEFKETEFAIVGREFIPIAKDVSVYVEKTNSHMTLSKAKTICKAFELYTNPNVKNQDMIWYIVGL